MPQKTLRMNTCRIGSELRKGLLKHFYKKGRGTHYIVCNKYSKHNNTEQNHAKFSVRRL